MSALSTSQLTPTCADSELVAAVRRGSDRAFEELYSRYRGRISAYILGIVRDHARAEDIAQEVFISALRRLRDTDRPIAFKAWIYEIAKNACIDEFRRTRRAREVPLEPEDDDADGQSRLPCDRADSGRRGREQAGARRPPRRLPRPFREPPQDHRDARVRGALVQPDRRTAGHVAAGRREHPVPCPAPARQGVRRARQRQALRARPDADRRRRAEVAAEARPARAPSAGAPSLPLPALPSRGSPRRRRRLPVPCARDRRQDRGAAADPVVAVAAGGRPPQRHGEHPRTFVRADAAGAEPRAVRRSRRSLDGDRPRGGRAAAAVALAGLGGGVVVAVAHHASAPPAPRSVPAARARALAMVQPPARNSSARAARRQPAECCAGRDRRSAARGNRAGPARPRDVRSVRDAGWRLNVAPARGRTARVSAAHSRTRAAPLPTAARIPRVQCCRRSPSRSPAW